jgi:pimeloyl-ACP methyl ester carboxylesterase
VIRWLVHGKIRLALHLLRPGEGRALLLLHELGGAAPPEAPAALARWPGPLAALDFTGHGRSTVPRGGGYHPEILMGDADAALAGLGRATLVGFGLGAYVALLLAGGRPESVRGAILCDGAGLAGGGPTPSGPRVAGPVAPSPVAPDPFALAELSADVRPPDYSVVFAAQAAALAGIEAPISVCASERPPWLAALVGMRGVRTEPLAPALERFAKLE